MDNMAAAHRCVARGDVLYRRHDFAGAAAAYREASRCFGGCIAAAGGEEDVITVLKMLRDSHVRKADRLEGMTTKFVLPAIDVVASWGGTARQPSSHMSPSPSPTPSAAPGQYAVRAAAQRFLNVLARPLDDLAAAAAAAAQPERNYDAEEAPPCSRQDELLSDVESSVCRDNRLMGSVFLIPSPVSSTPAAALEHSGLYLRDSSFPSQSTACLLQSGRVDMRSGSGAVRQCVDQGNMLHKHRPDVCSKAGEFVRLFRTHADQFRKALHATSRDAGTPGMRWLDGEVSAFTDPGAGAGAGGTDVAPSMQGSIETPCSKCLHFEAQQQEMESLRQQLQTLRSELARAVGMPPFTPLHPLHPLPLRCVCTCS